MHPLSSICMILPLIFMSAGGSRRTFVPCTRRTLIILIKALHRLCWLERLWLNLLALLRWLLRWLLLELLRWLLLELLRWVPYRLRNPLCKHWMHMPTTL